MGRDLPVSGQQYKRNGRSIVRPTPGPTLPPNPPPKTQPEHPLEVMSKEEYEVAS